MLYRDIVLFVWLLYFFFCVFSLILSVNSAAIQNRREFSFLPTIYILFYVSIIFERYVSIINGTSECVHCGICRW